MTYPTIGLYGLTAGRLVFEHNGRQYIYDSRGYEFAKDDRGREYAAPLFGAYDDGWPKYFAFCYADCFDPPQYLICARTFEDAYDIFLDEFASIPDDDDVEELIRDDMISAAQKGKIECGFQWCPDGVDEETSLEYLKTQCPDAYEKLWSLAVENLGNDGQVTFAPSGARKHEPGKKWGCLRWAESVQGHELKLIRAENFAA